MPEFTLVLASASPRRHDLLRLTGVPFSTLDVDIDEQVVPDETAFDYVNRLATGKAAAGIRRVLGGKVSDHNAKKVIVLGADTSVVAGNEILGKPVNYEDARRMLLLLSGGWHQVYTAIALSSVTAPAEQAQSPSNWWVSKVLSRVIVSKVKFRQLVESEIQWYWETGEPADKAGSYAIQGSGGIFIEKIEGSYSGIVGLPLCETAELLGQVGVYPEARHYE